MGQHLVMHIDSDLQNKLLIQQAPRNYLSKTLYASLSLSCSRTDVGMGMSGGEVRNEFTIAHAHSLPRMQGVN